MSEPNQPVQNYEVISPAIETLLRTQLPSVAGYGGLVRATNTIIPVLDVSAAAEGTSLDTDLARALAFGSQTAFEVTNSTSNIATVPGFYRVIGVLTNSTGSSNTGGGFTMTDGASTKQIYALIDSGHSKLASESFDFIVWLATGITLTAFSDTSNCVIAGSIRQVADASGTIVSPAGFPV